MASVVIMGLGTVFFGLICIILLTMLMGRIIGVQKESAPAASTAAPAAAAAPAVPVPAAAPAPAGVAPEIVAVITAVLAEDPGISSRGVNITSIKKV